MKGAAFAAQAGEDYELCFCAAPGSRERIESALGALADGPLPISWIGTVGTGAPAGARFAEVPGLAGYEHRL